jgi:hypothetical protein
VECWGEAPFPPTGEFTAISAGNDGACGIRPDGTVTCWGPGASIDLWDLPPEGVKFSAVDASYTNVCGITTAGDVRCWGDALH